MPGPDDPTLAEVYALYNAIHLALDCCFRDVLFESDSAKVISLINNAEENPRNYIGNMINGICSNRSSFRKCSFHHISREANRVAHILAGLTHEEPNKVWIEEDPPQLEIFSSHPP
jgi:ribonuclease HI